MNLRKAPSSKAWAAGVALTGLALVAGLFFARAYFGQNKNPLVDQANAGPPAEIKGLFDDWTMHHVVFTDTTDPSVLAREQHDPRWWVQQLRRNHGQGSNALNNGVQFQSEGLFASIVRPLLATPMKEPHA